MGTRQFKAPESEAGLSLSGPCAVRPTGGTDEYHLCPINNIIIIILFCHLQRRTHVRLHGHTKTRRRVAIQIVRSNAP
jgi:hypothetical protein